MAMAVMWVATTLGAWAAYDLSHRLLTFAVANIGLPSGYVEPMALLGGLAALLCGFTIGVFRGLTELLTEIRNVRTSHNKA